MKLKTIIVFLCISITCITMYGCEAEKNGSDVKNTEVIRTITDDNGNEVELRGEINNVVVCDIYPLASVITIYLGSAEKLAGIHPVCMSAARSGLLGELFPEILNADTSFMTGSDLNIEELLKLDPDLVFYNASNKALGSTLEKSGMTAVAVSARKWDYDILETYDQWVALLSRIFPERADISDKISSYSKEIYKEIQESTSKIKDEDKKKILFLFKYDESSMITSGKKFFGQFWCESVGGVNVAEVVAAENANALINMEQVYEWNPDIIFITNFTSTQPVDLYENNIGGDDWSSIRAVKNRDVYKLPLGSYRGYTPGADTPVILSWMAKKVYPELFTELNIEKEVKDYYRNLYGVELTGEQINRMYNPSRSAAAGNKS